MTVLLYCDCRRPPPLDEAYGFLSPYPLYMSLQRVATRGRFYAAIRIVGHDEHASYTFACARLLTRATAGLLRDAKGALLDDERDAPPLTRAQLEAAWRAELVEVEVERERIAAERRRQWRREHGDVAMKVAANDWSEV